MIVTSWIFLVLLSCLCQALVPVEGNEEIVPDEGIALPEKRSNVDRSFIRFGRSNEADKRGADKSFLRFGRSWDYDDEESSSLSASKRDRNFLRFGRNRNFLRFGRSGPQDIDLEGAAIEDDVAAPEEPADSGSIHRPVLANRNFLRFGRQYNKNFLRFGRSVD